MQQTRTHKAVTRRVEAKKLLSRRRKSEYSGVMWLETKKKEKKNQKIELNQKSQIFIFFFF